MSKSLSKSILSKSSKTKGPKSASKKSMKKSTPLLKKSVPKSSNHVKSACAKSKSTKLKSKIQLNSQTTKLSQSLIGASRKSAIKSTSKKSVPKSTSSKKSNKSSKSINASSSMAQLPKQIKHVMATSGAVKLKNIKEMSSKGYSIVDMKPNKDNIHGAKGPGGKQMVVKVISVKSVTPRYKINLEKYSLKIMKFVGKKPLSKAFPTIFDIFYVSYLYFEFPVSVI